MMLSALFAANLETGERQWASLPPAWLLVVIVVVGYLWIRSLYRGERGRAGPAARTFLTLVRLAVLVLIILVLGGPYRQETRTTSERSHLVVLVDSSASMKVNDTYPDETATAIQAALWPEGGAPDLSTLSRGDLLKRALAPEDAGHPA